MSIPVERWEACRRKPDGRSRRRPTGLVAPVPAETPAAGPEGGPF
jgi:hypothetical protein